MPNWCDNVVMIRSSDKEELKMVREFLIDARSEFSFNKIKPCPQALLNASAPNRSEQSIKYNISKYGAKDWYDWGVKNWGTKWNSRDVSVTEFYNGDDNQVAYSFSTAWSPPLEVYDKLAEMFPNINIFINYDESGMGFSGWKYYADGECAGSKEYDGSYHGIRVFMEPDTEIWGYLE